MIRRLLIAILIGLFFGNAESRAQTVVAGADELNGTGGPDGWTNVLYINESIPFDFGGTGQSQGVLTYVNFWVADSRAETGIFTPFIAEPLNDDPQTGDEFVIRAIGTTREGGTDWECGGLYQYPFHDTEQFVVQNDWLVGFMSSDPLGEREDALSPIPFAGAGVEGWLTGTATAGSGAPAIEVGEVILEGGSQTFPDGAGLREYQFQVEAAAGTTQPPLAPGGKVGDACPQPAAGNVAGTAAITGAGGPDGWTNVLYINEERPFDFSEFGADSGTLDEVRFFVAPGREFTGLVTPFVAEPLVDSPVTGDDFIVRAIGTTREGGVDWEESGEVAFPFSDTETFEVQSGWLAGFVSSDPLGESDLAQSPIPFVGSNINGWLAGSPSAGTGSPAIELNEPILEGQGATNVDAYGFRDYAFQIWASTGPPAEPGDFNADGLIDAADIDLLTAEVVAGTNNLRFDLNEDGFVTDDDRTVWVDEIKNTYFGDANLDGVFASDDFVAVFQAGKYENDVEDDAGWAEGDWDGDLDFDSSDFVKAFQGGGYELGPKAAVSAVPEPGGMLLLLTALWPLSRTRRRRSMV